MTPFWLIFFVLGCWVIFVHGGENWCYKGKNCGPSHWSGQCNTGKAQSPIDLQSKSEGSREEKGSLRFNEDYFKTHETFFISNNGHSVQVQLREGVRAELEGYTFAQLHFHWGHENSRGSEHTVDSKSYPMEVHLVHYANHYSNLTTALRGYNPRALAVLGVFFQITEQDNLALESIISNIPLVTYPQMTLAKGNLNLMGFLPSKLDLSLWRYEGSLTTPNCDEKVIWSVFQQPISISERQIQVFRGLKDSRGLSLVNNFRPSQSREGRRVKLIKIKEIELIEKIMEKNIYIDLVMMISILISIGLIWTMLNVIFYRLRLRRLSPSKYLMFA